MRSKLITTQDQLFRKKEQKQYKTSNICHTIQLTCSIVKKHLPIITDNPNLVEMFPKDSIFCAYKGFPNLKYLIVSADPDNIKPLKERDQDPVCSDCMKRYDSCKNFADHISSFECFATFLKIFKIRRSLTCTTPNMICLAYCTKCGKQGVGSTENENLDFLIINCT